MKSRMSAVDIPHTRGNGSSATDDTREWGGRGEDEELKTSMWEDVCDAVYESRYVSVLALLVALYCGYSVTIAPYQSSSRPTMSPEQRSLETLVSTNTFALLMVSTLLGDNIEFRFVHRNIFDQC